MHNTHLKCVSGIRDYIIIESKNIVFIFNIFCMSTFAKQPLRKEPVLNEISIKRRLILNI